jgi:type II secretory pathway pseudopilin PulG
VIATINNSRAKARDAQRKHDLSQIQLALEMYYDTYGGYPSSAWPNVDYKITRSLALEPKISEFITKFPKDPNSANNCYNNTYLYISNVYNDGSSNNAKATKYVLYATLEDQNFNNLNSPLAGLDAWLAGGAGACGGSSRPNYRFGQYN